VTTFSETNFVISFVTLLSVSHGTDTGDMKVNIQ